MDPELRRAWTEIVTPDDYDRHMAAVGQAQAAAELTEDLIRRAHLAPSSRITIAGAGTGQMFDSLDPEVFRPHHLTCSDLNPVYLERLRARLLARGLEAQIVEDDFERTQLDPHPDLFLCTLLLEHIEWRRGVAAIASLAPRACGIIFQENPPGMTTAVTPGRTLPPSLAKAVETAHPTLVPRDDLIAAMAAAGYTLASTTSREVADAKRLLALLLIR